MGAPSKKRVAQGEAARSTAVTLYNSSRCGRPAKRCHRRLHHQLPRPSIVPLPRTFTSLEPGSEEYLMPLRFGAIVAIATVGGQRRQPRPATLCHAACHSQEGAVVHYEYGSRGEYEGPDHVEAAGPWLKLCLLRLQSQPARPWCSPHGRRRPRRTAGRLTGLAPSVALAAYGAHEALNGERTQQNRQIRVVHVKWIFVVKKKVAKQS